MIIDKNILNVGDNIKMGIPLFKIYWDEDDIKVINDVIKRGSQWADGPEIKTFEENISNYVNRKYAITFNSGTSALHAILMSYDIKQGDEVIVPSFSFISTANSVLFVGAKPVFAEIEDKTFGLDVEDVKERINNKTKAIIPVHYGGCPCLYIKALKEIADDYNLFLIEDAAESLGSKIDNTMVGSFGDSAMFSFCQNKTITTGEGGAIVTDDEDTYKKLKLSCSHGRLDNGDYFSTSKNANYISLGYNFRIPTVLAALGISQLNKINKIVNMRRKNAELLSKKLQNIDMLRIPKPPINFYNIYQMYTIEVLSEKYVRDKLIDALLNANISSKIYFNPIHLTEYYRRVFNYKEGDYTITEGISNRVLSLPIYPNMLESEIDIIYQNIKRFFIPE